MIYFVMLSIPLLMGPIRSIPYGKPTYRYLVALYFIALMLLAGLRWKTGTDWYAYHDFFGDLDNSLVTFEFGYVWLTELVREFSRNYTVFLLFDSLLALLPIWYVLAKENDGDPIALALFCSYYFTINYLGANRRIIACGLCFLALHALIKGRRLLFFGFCAIAFCFHRSSIVFLLAWPIYHLKPNKKLYFAAMAVAVAFLVFNPIQRLASLLAAPTDVMILVKIVTYSNNTYLSPDVNYAVQDAISIAKRSIFLVLIWWGWRRQNPDKLKEYGGLLNLYVFSFVFYLMFTGTVEVFKTMTIYFSIVELILIPLALSRIAKEWRPAAYVLFAFVLFAQEYSALKGYWELFVPYRSVLMVQAQ